MSDLSFIHPLDFTDIIGDHELTKGAPQRPRDWKKIKTIVLHQTACKLGNDPVRYHNVACHVAVPSDGQIFYVNNLRHPVWHGHGFNSDSVGIEIDGHFAGIEGVPHTIWRNGGPTHQLTPEQINGAKMAIIWIVGEVAVNGGDVVRVVAHRQGSNQRQGDPGSAIWREIGLWAQEELGLQNHWWETVGSGMAIPRSWDIGSFFNWWGVIDSGGIGIVQAVANKRVDAGLDVDGVSGPLTRGGLGELLESLGIEEKPKLQNKQIEAIAGCSEYREVVRLMEDKVDDLKIACNLVEGDHTIDILDGLAA